MFNGKIHYKLPFSIAIVITRGYLLYLLPFPCHLPLQEERLAEAKAHLTLARDALRASDASDSAVAETLYPFWDSHGQFWDGEKKSSQNISELISPEYPWLLPRNHDYPEIIIPE